MTHTTDQTTTPDRPSLAATLHQMGRRRADTFYHKDLDRGRLEVRSFATTLATEITGTTYGHVEHTAVWTILAIADLPGKPVVGRPGSRVSLPDTLLAAVGTQGVKARHINAVRFLHLGDMALNGSRERVPGELSKLLRVLAQGVRATQLPDPLLLAADLTRLLHPHSDAQREQIGRWHSALARA